ncbi:hypothetical protein [Halobacillus litoralis]|uniref:hypothetical protein n=1 Tax=Halobacillus litoralis TaxID=45668 RepID=UPI001CD60D69|nr:hypothetical protein [Halobacillus litoralis]MCA1021585.1 hypothetical protein [Halobacillus litoralis]
MQLNKDQVDALEFAITTLRVEGWREEDDRFLEKADILKSILEDAADELKGNTK